MQHAITIGDMLYPVMGAHFVESSKNENGTPGASTYFVGTGKEPVMVRFLSNDWKKTLQKKI